MFIATTAFHVNENGPMGYTFEVQIREKQKGNPRFDFLKPSSPYHGWYRQKVKEAAEGRDVKAEAEAGAVRALLLALVVLEDCDLIHTRKFSRPL